MSAKFCIIFFCITLIFIPNFIEPPCAFAAEGQFELGFGSFMSFFNRTAEVKDSTLYGGSEIMDNFGKRIFKFSNGLFGFFPIVPIFSQKISNENIDQPSENKHGRNSTAPNKIDRWLITHFQCPEIVVGITSIVVGIFLAELILLSIIFIKHITWC